MRTHFRNNRLAILASLAAWLLLLLVLFTLPVAFSGYQQGDWDTSSWYFLSQSGGVYGTTLLVLVLCGAFASIRSGQKKKLIAFVGSFSFFTLVLGGVAFTNEYGLKPLLHQPRPSHLYLLQPARQDTTLIPQFYRNTVEQRRAYLLHFIQSHPDKVKAISPAVLNHWVMEAGYSFPSGHAQNAFLLATILVFWLVRALPPHKYYWLAVPLTWAVLVSLSRVALGVHAETDVAAGAAAGLLLTFVLSLTGILNRLFGVLPAHLN